MKLIKRLLPILLVMVSIQLGTMVWSFAATNTTKELSYTSLNVVAAYSLKIIHFVDFPNNAKPDSFCVIEDDLLGVTLSQMQASSGNYKGLSIKKKNATSPLDECDVIFFGPQSEEFIRAISHSLKNKPVLTLSNVSTALEKGVMIGFVETENSVTIDISLANTKSSGLNISSKLLNVARSVLYE